MISSPRFFAPACGVDEDPVTGSPTVAWTLLVGAAGGRPRCLAFQASSGRRGQGDGQRRSRAPGGSAVTGAPGRAGRPVSRRKGALVCPRASPRGQAGRVPGWLFRGPFAMPAVPAEFSDRKWGPPIPVRADHGRDVSFRRHCRDIDRGLRDRRGASWRLASSFPSCAAASGIGGTPLDLPLLLFAAAEVASLAVSRDLKTEPAQPAREWVLLFIRSSFRPWARRAGCGAATICFWPRPASPPSMRSGRVSPASTWCAIGSWSRSRSSTSPPASSGTT